MAITKEAEPVLAVHNLSVKFRMYHKGLKQHDLEVISSLNVTIRPGEILAVVGSSGSGKSLLAHAIFGILPANGFITGEMAYCGQELTPEYQSRLRGHEMALVPQSVAYLDPLMRVGEQVRGVYGTRGQQKKAFARYGLDQSVEQKFPFQLSGGMTRRVLVSTAVISEARLIIADEPTPGLNPEMARETMRNFRELADEGRAIMLITHDIDLALQAADRIAVFYGGTTVEIAPVDDFIRGEDALRHPYSKALYNALPQNGFRPIEGSQPYAGSLPTGCLFAPRCSLRTEDCAGDIPMRELREGEVRCIHAT